MINNFNTLLHKFSAIQRVHFKMQYSGFLLHTLKYILRKSNKPTLNNQANILYSKTIKISQNWSNWEEFDFNKVNQILILYDISKDKISKYMVSQLRIKTSNESLQMLSHNLIELYSDLSKIELTGIELISTTHSSEWESDQYQYIRTKIRKSCRIWNSNRVSFKIFLETELTVFEGIYIPKSENLKCTWILRPDKSQNVSTKFVKINHKYSSNRSVITINLLKPNFEEDISTLCHQNFSDCLVKLYWLSFYKFSEFPVDSMKSLLSLNLFEIRFESIICNPNIVDAIWDHLLSNKKLRDLELYFDKNAYVMKVLTFLKHNFMIKTVRLRTKEKSDDKIDQLVEILKRERISWEILIKYRTTTSNFRFVKATEMYYNE